MIGNRLIKVCGMTDASNIRAVEDLNINGSPAVDLLGFIFYPKSPRCVRRKPSYLPTRAARAGVFVDVPVEEIQIQDIMYNFTYIQPHGHETPEYCQSLKKLGFKLIKAISIASEQDLEAAGAYEGLCDYFIFDTKCASVGGSGSSFDWSILEKYDGKTPFLLSGGLGPDNADSIAAFSHPLLAGLDLNSKFETQPGIKDIALLESFLNKLNK